MQMKPKNEKQARLLYLAVVGVLIISALIIGLVAALGKSETPELRASARRPSRPDTKRRGLTPTSRASSRAPSRKRRSRRKRPRREARSGRKRVKNI